MFMKCRYMDEITGGKGITFATGTPVSNSMTELYTIMTVSYTHLPISESDNSGNRSTDREIRNAAEDISEGVQEQPVPEFVADRETEQPSGGDRESSTGEILSLIHIYATMKSQKLMKNQWKIFGKRLKERRKGNRR